MRLKIHRTIYIVLLLLLVGSMTTSNFMMNLAWVLLFANWLVEWDMKRKFAGFSRNGFLHVAILYFILHLVAMLWTDNFAYGIDDIRQKLRLIAIPLVILTSAPLSKRQWRMVAFVYIVTIFVVTIIGVVRYLTIPDIPYRQIVPFISHIRFSLNVCMAMCILIAAITHCGEHILHSVVMLLLCLWFLAFLLLIQSYTGLVILLISCVIMLVIGWKHIPNKPVRWVSVSFLAVVLLVVGGISIYYVNEYYTPRTSSVGANRLTANGNPYTHRRDGLVECGRYVNDYVCESELRSQWPRVSSCPLDSITPTGYPVYPALVRYLNAAGLTKDSAGVSHLSPTDIAAIEQGIANPVYLQQASLRRMYYVMLFEYENYRAYGSVIGFTMLQRIELWENAYALFRENLICGVGPGDVRDALDARLCNVGSPLAGSHRLPHNQYLTLLLSFGLVGFLLLLAALIWALVRTRSLRHTLFATFFTIATLSFLTEDTLETMAGAVFIAFFLSLLSARTGPHVGPRPPQPEFLPDQPSDHQN